MNRKPKKLIRPSDADNAAITAAARKDRDNPPLTTTELAQFRRMPGRPKSANTKQPVSVRYSQEVIAYFRATGEGWQVRMDTVLRDYIATHPLRVRKNK